MGFAQLALGAHDNRPIIEVIRKLREAAKILEVELLDDLIVGDPKADPLKRGIFSFREAGLL